MAKKSRKEGVPVATTARKREASQGFIALMTGISVVICLSPLTIVNYYFYSIT